MELYGKYERHYADIKKKLQEMLQEVYEILNDAKITYLKDGVEQRMNGTCAGDTGSFMDQMASMLKIDAAQLNELAENYKTIYPIVARCGVFAKTDVQLFLN